MAGSRCDTDILIVGAGPVGLFLANECARRGLRWRLLEKRTSQSEHSKALAIFPRTLEIFEMAGVVEPFLAAANQVTRVAIMARGHTLARIPFSPEQSPYPFVAMVPQDVTERLLVERLQSRGGAVESAMRSTCGLRELDTRPHSCWRTCRRTRRCRPTRCSFARANSGHWRFFP